MVTRMETKRDEVQSKISQIEIMSSGKVIGAFDLDLKNFMVNDSPT
jgi:hypothetical protein